MRRPALLAFALLFAGGCCGGLVRSVGVLGPNLPSHYGLGVWRGDTWSMAEAEHAPGKIHSVSADDLRKWGLEGRWQLIAYEPRPAPPDARDVVVLARVRRLDGKDGGPPRLDDVIATLEKRQLADLAELHHAVLAPPRFEREQTQASAHYVQSIAWLGERLRVVMYTVVVAVHFGQPCSGAPQPPRMLAGPGVSLSRTYEVDRQGGITRTAAPPLVEVPEPFCDPRVQ